MYRVVCLSTNEARMVQKVAFIASMFKKCTQYLDFENLLSLFNAGRSSALQIIQDFQGQRL